MKPPTLGEYWTTLNALERRALARDLDTSVEYVYQMAAGYRRPSPAMAIRISDLTGIPRHSLRADIWTEEDDRD